MTTILLCMWLLMLVTFSVPGREGPSSFATLDWIAVLKVATRGLVPVALAIVVARRWHTRKRVEVVQTIWPFFAFVAWATLSTLWSPLPAFTFGQAFTTGVLGLLATAIALECRHEDQSSAVLKQLTVGCLVVSATLLGIHVAGGSWSGLDRSWEDGGAVGLMHPTSAGATASLGLVALVAIALIWKWPWSRAALLPAVLVHAAVLLIALSRTGLGLAVLLLALVVLWRGNRLVVASGTLALSMAAVAYPLVDPELATASDLFGSVAQYMRRGESAETMRTLTGRTELWQAVWASVLESPVVGYGYHMASSDGVLDVWGRPAVRTAHNLALHILVSTGLVGFGLFSFGLLRPLRRAVSALGLTAEGRRLRQLLLVLGLWFLGWSLLSESFMGPLQPESVVFFAVFGLAVGRVCERP
jgi:O-antigen ligase